MNTPPTGSTGRPPLGRKPRFRRVPFRLIAPNAVTLLALSSGLTSIRFSMEGRIDWAIAAIVVAAILDGLDGRVARLLRSTSRFGAELDSLADFVNFGVAPAILLYTWSLHELKSLGWIAAILFAIATALRLARFNVMLDDTEKPKWHNMFFVGIPSPAGAIIVLLPVYLGQLGLLPDGAKGMEPAIAAFVLALAFMVASRLPAFSGKGGGIRVSRDLFFPVMIVTVLAAGLLVSYPYEMLSGVTILYLATVPIAWRVWHRHARKDLKQGGFAPDGGADDPPAVETDKPTDGQDSGDAAK